MTTISPPHELGRFAPGISELARERLDRFAHLLAEWQQVHNLVSSGTLGNLWQRHIADSLQLLHHAPTFAEWTDLGSGAGFPGLVVAIASPEGHVTLVEANQKKAAFLRAAIRITGANASVAAERIEKHAARMAGRADVVSVRALAPLPKLLALAAPYLHQDSVILLLKGQDVVHEQQAAAKSWDFDVVSSPSVTDPAGCVLAIRNLRPKAFAS